MKQSGMSVCVVEKSQRVSLKHLNKEEISRLHNDCLLCGTIIISLEMMPSSALELNLETSVTYTVWIFIGYDEICLEGRVYDTDHQRFIMQFICPNDIRRF